MIKDLYENTKNNIYFKTFKDTNISRQESRNSPIQLVSMSVPVKNNGTARTLTKEGRIILNYLLNPESETARSDLISLSNEILKGLYREKNTPERKRYYEFNRTVVGKYKDIDRLLANSSLVQR